jgi:hypothetical protein
MMVYRLNCTGLEISHPITERLRDYSNEIMISGCRSRATK